MKVYKITCCFIDFDSLGEKGAISLIENTRYPNHTIAPSVQEIEAVDIGEWDDSNPLNFTNKREEEFKRLFEK